MGEYNEKKNCFDMYKGYYTEYQNRLCAYYSNPSKHQKSLLHRKIMYSPLLLYIVCWSVSDDHCSYVQQK